jgi:hypothetical protein
MFAFAMLVGGLEVALMFGNHSVPGTLMPHAFLIPGYAAVGALRRDEEPTQPDRFCSCRSQSRSAS